MNKAEWDKMDAREKNDLVWAAFPTIPPEEEVWVLSTDGGESCFISYDTEREAKRALLALEQSNIDKTDSRYGAKVFLWRYPLYFTTDRNACALVLDGIEKRNRHLQLRDILTGAVDSGDSPGLLPDRSGWTNFSDYMAQSDFDLLCINPDTICYCAIKTVENAE